MSQYIVKPVAEKEVTKQAKFISRDGLLRAKDFVDYIYSKFQFLAENPSIGRDASRYGSNLLVWSDRKYKVYIYFTSHVDHIAIERVIGMRQSQLKSFKL